MGLTYQHVDGGDGSYGQIRYKTWDVTWDSSYVTGGELVDKSQVGLSSILGAQCLGVADAASGGILPAYIPSTGKMLAMRSGLGTVIGNVTVVGGTLGEATGINPDSNAGVLSKAAATNRTIPIATYLGAAPTVAAGALAEVGNGISLAAITHRIMFFGN